MSDFPTGAPWNKVQLTLLMGQICKFFMNGDVYEKSPTTSVSREEEAKEALHSSKFALSTIPRTEGGPQALPPEGLQPLERPLCNGGDLNQAII